MSLTLSGRGLHGGAPSTVRFACGEGPTTFGRGVDRAALAELVVHGEDRATTVVLPSGARIQMVEHVFAAISGTGAFDGIAIDLEGDELPLLDGAAAEFHDALCTLAPAPSPRRAVVVSEATFHAYGTLMHVAPGPSSITVVLDFPEERFGRRLVGEASWDGDARTFREAIATARTFGAAREVEHLRARGLAAHLPPGSVVALDLDDPAYAARDPAEPLRHKLLDAIGDLAVLGASIEGSVRIEKPSHRGTHAALALAREKAIEIRNS
ncbi:MAG: UDP-3-O-acyl-N-acetylglucosamine deacetylase [Polyangiales bacterium]